MKQTTFNLKSEDLSIPVFCSDVSNPHVVHDASGLKVVVADDQATHRKFLSLLIQKMGHTPIPARDGLEALDLIKIHDASILISDFQMPGLDGVDVTRRVRQLNSDNYVHVILVTGNETEALRLDAMNAGVDDFITKGSAPQLIQARIKAASRIVEHEIKARQNSQDIRDAHIRIQKDLSAASKAQFRLLPESQIELSGFKVASAFQASKSVSGDMFNVFELEDNKLGFYAIDVSGHGVQASLLSVAIWHFLTPELFAKKCNKSDGTFSPAELVKHLNGQFVSSDTDQYFTMFCAVVDPKNDELVFCQAGCPSPLQLRKDMPPTSIGDGGYPVGLFPDADFEDHKTTLNASDRLLLFSDGAPEATNPQGIQFGESRLMIELEQHRNKELETLPDALCQALQTWRQGEQLEDDLTLIALERKS